MKKTLLILSLLLLFVWTFNSCIKDNFDFDKWDKELTWEPSFVAPVAWGDLCLADAIVAYDTTIQLIENESGFVSILYRTTIESREISDLIVLPDQSYNGVVNGLDIDFSGFDVSGDVLTGTVNETMSFALFNDECQIDTIVFKSGILNSLVQSTYKHTLQLELIFPTIKKGDDVLKLTYFFPPVGGFSESNDNNLVDYHVDLTQTPLGYNEVPVQINYTFYHSGNDNTGNIIFNCDFTNLNYSLMTGYFGYNSIIFDSDTLDINLFKNENFNVDEYFFQDPKFKVYYHNSYGIPTNFYFTEMFAQSKINDQYYSIIDYQNGLPLDSLHPYLVQYANEIGTFRDDSIILNRFNSNIPQVISIQPKWIQFIAHAHTNPEGLNHNNFITDESLLSADVEVELPLWGYIDNFHASDTSDFDFSEMYDIAKMIKRLAIRLDMKNGFPVEGYGQVYFLDENYHILDSVLASGVDRIIPAAACDEQGRVLDFARKTNIIEITGDRIENIKNAKYICYQGHTNSSGYSEHKLVKVYGDYRIKFDLSFEVEIEASIDLDTIN